MTQAAPVKVYFVVGEESGDILGARILQAFSDLGAEIDAIGLAGRNMQKAGMNSLFETSDLSVMGISGVVARLPQLLSRIRQTADDIIREKPDVLLLIDSPEFAYRVAKRVRKQNPSIRIVKFVAPSVWAWRPGRARKIAPYIDHILALLPFEPDLMKELGGPETSYVGHPIASMLSGLPATGRKKPNSPVQLVVLPGSRRSELKLLMPVIRDTLEFLQQREKVQFEVTLPAVERFSDEIASEVSQWPVKPRVVSSDEDKEAAFLNADVALCASGTVTLELAAYRVPMISIYKLDRMMMLLRHLITAWTTCLPNLVADYPFVPEKLNENSHPHHLGRMLERLATDSPERQAQLEGFEVVARNLRQDEPPQIIAARKLLELADRKTGK